MYADCKPTTKKVKKERMNTVGIDVGKRKCRAAIKDRSGQTLNEFFFSNDKDGINKLTKIVLGYGNCEAVVESTANMWIRIHDTLEDNGINTVLANPYKTRIIAEAKIKSDKLDARILADLLRSVWYINHMFLQRNLERKEVLSDIESHWLETEHCLKIRYILY